jgi:hypothetical protein
LKIYHLATLTLILLLSVLWDGAEFLHLEINNPKVTKRLNFQGQSFYQIVNKKRQIVKVYLMWLYAKLNMAPFCRWLQETILVTLIPVEPGRMEEAFF